MTKAVETLGNASKCLACDNMDVLTAAVNLGDNQNFLYLLIAIQLQTKCLTLTCHPLFIPALFAIGVLDYEIGNIEPSFWEKSSKIKKKKNSYVCLF